MKKIEFICALPSKGKLGGETLKNKTILKYLKENNIKVRVTNFSKYKKFKFLVFFECLITLLNPFTNKILISKASKSSYIYLKLARYLNIYKKKIYYMVIGGKFDQYLKNENFKIKYYSKIEKIYVESYKMKDALIKLGLEQTEYLPNFKSFKLVNRTMKDEKYPLEAVFFSRILPEKGTEMIFKMLESINEKEIMLKIFFYGPIEKNYEKIFFKKIKEIKEVKYEGILDSFEEETFDILKNYDFMIFPTFWDGEGFPGTIVDSLISSLPIVASDWNVNKEIINDKIGFLFEARNQSKFEKLIKFIINNKKELIKKRGFCFEESKKYNVDNVLKRLKKELL